MAFSVLVMGSGDGAASGADGFSGGWAFCDAFRVLGVASNVSHPKPLKQTSVHACAFSPVTSASPPAPGSARYPSTYRAGSPAIRHSTVIADADTAGEAVSGGDAAQEASDGGEKSAAQNSEPVMDTGSEPSRILTQAQLLAASYDYDGAISLLKGIDSQDPSVTDAIVNTFELTKTPSGIVIVGVAHFSI